MNSNRAAESGFSLIELLVAMAIGLLLTLLVANLFVGTRATNSQTDEVSRMQENIRFTYQLLTRTIHHAGYRSDPSADPTLTFTAGKLAITGTENSGAPVANTDTITVSYQGSGTGAGAGDGAVVDCLGTPFDQNVTVSNTFFLRNGTNGQPALFCTRTGGGLATVTTELVPDVDNMQILYGEDTGIGQSQDFIPDHFVPITGVANPDRILAVRIALLFSTNNPSGVSSARTDLDTTQYNLNGTVLAPFNDRQIRRVAVLTINLRNRTPY